jgi:NAD-dependent protein deacetylase/lipoamidase
MQLREAKEWISFARRIVGFTGAGISTESGIPDFRSPGGVWSTARMIDYGEFISSRDARIESWRQKVIAWRVMRDAQPNAGHKAFVELEQRGQLTTMITQNIDRLHQRAGHSPDRVIELHGTMTEAVCLRCDQRISMDDAVARVVAGDEEPRCEGCGGMLKPATVSFGQPMPVHEMRIAEQQCRECDVLIAAGSSLVVYPAASLPACAKDEGARLIIINRTPTPLDYLADLVINDEIGKALPGLIG